MRGRERGQRERREGNQVKKEGRINEEKKEKCPLAGQRRGSMGERKRDAVEQRRPGNVSAYGEERGGQRSREREQE